MVKFRLDKKYIISGIQIGMILHADLMDEIIEIVNMVIEKGSVDE